MSGSTANRSTMPSTWSARPMPTGPSSTPSAPTRRWPGTGRHRSTAGWRTRPSPTFPSPKSCQLLDAGQVLGELERVGGVVELLALRPFAHGLEHPLGHRGVQAAKDPPHVLDVLLRRRRDVLLALEAALALDVLAEAQLPPDLVDVADYLA